MIRKEFNIDLAEVRERAKKYGRIIYGKVFLNQFASEKLIEAVSSQGFEPLIALGVEKDQDIDVYMAAEIMEASYSSNIDVIVMVSRDTDFLPIIQKAKKRGKTTVVMGSDPGFSIALKNAADHVEDLTKRA
ncbi:MAG: NYN domain-containing protein [Candidatus Aenigmarchaeota archaeon]|nr:NYN domain-containing protein [Candidatus Aenigmarchaeota archaeon]